MLLFLQELLNWSMSRHVWYPRAAALRLEFEGNKAVVRFIKCCCGQDRCRNTRLATFSDDDVQ